MNFKALALGSVLALGSIFGSVSPAEAGTCWFDNNRGSLSPTYCQTGSRVNYNGHKVWDVVDHQGTKFTLVFWDDQVVEIVGMTARPVQATWYTDRDGDVRIKLGNSEMAIRF